MRRNALLATAIAGVVFLLDWFTKRWIENNFSYFDTKVVIPGFFALVRTENRGVAFSLFNDASEGVRQFVVLGVAGCVTLFVAGYLVWLVRQNHAATAWLRAGLAAVLGGALGNLADRVMYGAVTDFLLFYWQEWEYPAFNIADAAIFCGACLLLLDMWRTRKEPT